jgi:hypothetical protein
MSGCSHQRGLPWGTGAHRGCGQAAVHPAEEAPRAERAKGGPLGWLQREARLPMLTIVFLIGGCNAVLDWNDNHVLTGVRGRSQAAPVPQPAAEAFKRWLGSRRDGPSNPAHAIPSSSSLPRAVGRVPST